MKTPKVFASIAFTLICSAGLGTADAQSIDIAKGQQRAAVCMACHGQDGKTTASPGIPRLAGQDRDYLIKALKAYRIGVTRSDETMTAMAKPLTDADISNIAAFFSGLP
ncbi:MAG TPA: cytochrome c [Bradyrhizobium sp.]|nr:cytochrome c [Bradyrhizobium sp.]